MHRESEPIEKDPEFLTPEQADVVKRAVLYAEKTLGRELNVLEVLGVGAAALKDYEREKQRDAKKIFADSEARDCAPESRT
jgi:hypothetical protein